MDYLSIEYQSLDLFVRFDEDGAFDGVYSFVGIKNGKEVFSNLDGVFSDSAMEQIEVKAYEALEQANECERDTAMEMRV